MIQEVIKHTVMITSFVLVMMLIIEYVNVQTRGKWFKPLQNNKWGQLLLAALLGVIPGCLGAYTIVSLYTHNIIGFGALVTAMIATSGDEAFIMFSMMPDVAIKLSVIILVIALVAGAIVNLFFKDVVFTAHKKQKFTLHEEEEECICFDRGNIINHLKKITFQRAVLLVGLLIFIFGLVAGEFSHNHAHDLVGSHQTEVVEPDHHEHTEVVSHEMEEHNNGEHKHTEACSHEDHAGENGWDWIRLTFLFTSLFALFVVVTVPDHFLKDHLWGHIIKKHFLKIFLWTLGALAFVAIMMQYIDLSQWMEANYFYILLAAVLIGVIPESGPHIVFLTLFFSGTIPFSILLANSIVQDGHGALPLFAESKKSFFVMKAINVLVGLIVGLIGFYLKM